MATSVSLSRPSQVPPPPSPKAQPPTATTSSISSSTSSIPFKPQLKKGFSTLTCRACTALTMGSRYYNPKRSTSPGAQKIVNPGRASDTTFSSSYAGSAYPAHAHSTRDDYRHPSTSAAALPRKTGGVIPISTEVVYRDRDGYPSSSSGSSASREVYSGRPRRSSDLAAGPPPPLRTRPAIVQDAGARPSSPLSRSFDPRDTYVKPNTGVRRSEAKTTLYSVDNNSAKLIAESEPHREGRDHPRRERAGYHHTGRSQRPRELVDESAWSYTDPAGMYNETEPVRRPRRGSVDGRRPTSVVEPPAYPTNYHRGSRDYGPPPTNRHFDKVNDVARTASVREPKRTSSRDRQGSYDAYGQREAYDIPLRSTATMPVVVDQQPPTDHRHSRDETYYRDEYDDYREPRHPTRQFADDSVPARGYGIRVPSVDGRQAGSNRMPSVDRHVASSNASSVEPPIARTAYPQSSAGYPDQSLVKMPSGSEYAPHPPPVDDRKEKPERRDRDRERDREREIEYERELERERERERAKERDRDRPRDREYEREDRGERHHHRRISRDPAESVRDAAVPVAATAVGVAGAAATGAAFDRKRNERKYESDDERAPRPRRDPNEREDERERRYAERDREERKGKDEKRDRDDRRDRDEKRDRDDRRERDEKRREEKPAIDPDEDYRRRVQQAQAELEGLSKTRSKDDDRTDSDRDRQRRRDREERERERRQSRDRDSRRGSDENAAPPKRSRARTQSVDSQGDAPHNRVPDHRVTDRNYVQEPDSIPGAYPQEPPQSTSRGMPPPPPPSSSVAPPSAGSMLPPPDIAPRSKSADPNASLSSSDRRVTIVEPPKDDSRSAEPALKGILRKPTAKFPEHPDSHREGVTPLKDRLKKEGKEIPDGAKWTKIDRRLVNPQALEEKGERFEERQDYVIVLRVLTKDEIQSFANRTAEIREEREERYNRERKRHSGQPQRSSHHHDRDETDDSEQGEYHHSSRRSHRDDEKESHRLSRDEGERERDREPRSSRKEYDSGYENEAEAALRAIEEGRRKDRNGRDLRDEFMSGGIGSTR